MGTPAGTDAEQGSDKDKLEDTQDALKSATGLLPVDDQDTFKDIVGELCVTWSITDAPEVMLVNRMVSTWMKMKNVEKMLGTYDLFFELRDKDGTIIGVRVNELANYLRSLEADFRSYYRVLSMRKPSTSEEINDFQDFLKKNVKAKKKKKSRGKK